MVITGLTRNQFAGNRTWVRIPPAPPHVGASLDGLLRFFSNVSGHARRCAWMGRFGYIYRIDWKAPGWLRLTGCFSVMSASNPRKRMYLLRNLPGCLSPPGANGVERGLLPNRREASPDTLVPRDASRRIESVSNARLVMYVPYSGYYAISAR